MRNLIIENLKYVIATEKGNTYGVDVPFEPGLNMIYGPNSVGKTSLITGIVYGLGAEKSLGIFQNKQNPFKPEFYDTIEGERVVSSHVLLEISTKEKSALLKRSIIGKTDVIEVTEITFPEEKLTIDRKMLIAAGDGVFSDNGLQKYLFDFLGWSIEDVPTYDLGTSKLYFENLMPLFFVEQRAGWSQIQARQVTRYKIRDVKKVAFEYIMGFERFKTHLKEIRKKEIQEQLLRKKDILKEREEDILVIINGEVNDDIILLQRKGISKTSIHEVIKIQEQRYKDEEKTLGIISDNKDTVNSDEQTLREQLKIASYRVRKQVEQANTLIQEINSYQGYIDRIKINQGKNKQLKKLDGLVKELNLSMCPVCENTLSDNEGGHCILCNQKAAGKLSTPDENLEFLEDEKTTFEQIQEKKKLELRKARHAVDKLKEEEKELIEQLDHQIKTYVGPELANYRKKVVDLDNMYKDIQLLHRTVERWERLKPQREKIDELTKELNTLTTEIGDYQQSAQDRTVLNNLLTNFKANVKEIRLLKGKDNLLNTIRIDEKDHYTPYLEAYDLYNISSSSDNVRIILSYYLAMLQTSLGLPTYPIRFPNLLVLDEPKQQNLDEQDLIKFIEIIEQLDKTQSQVILTTYSEGKTQKDRFVKYIRHEMKSEDDYLLKKMNS